MAVNNALGATRLQERRALDRLRGGTADAPSGGVPEDAYRALLLIEEFEQTGKGWFWETDDEGKLTYASISLEESVAPALQHVVGRKLTDLLSEEGSSEQRSLAFHLAHGLTFSELMVRARGDRDMWWAVSGRPVRNAKGRVTGFRGIGTDLTEKRRAETEVARLAHFDGLTGLPNRTMMRKVLEKALTEGGGLHSNVSVILIDLDRFKQVNDTLGHPAGDILLTKVADRLRSVIGELGEVGRLGGDEFQAVLPNFVETDLLSKLAEKLAERVAAPYSIRGQKISIGASLGIATTDTARNADELIRDADLALYAAKASNLQSYRFFSQEMHSAASERQELETQLRAAISDHGLSLVYQPIVMTRTEEIVGFEALLRWLHPTQGPVSPSRFVPVAEETGLIVRMGEWVIRTACAEAAKWPAHIRLAVNLSPVQFSDPSLPSLIMNALASSQLAPSRLELEITEGVFLNDGPAVQEIFARLKGMGVRFALDDFGTGYSSLGYLQRAPFNKIKIDQSFVRGSAKAKARDSAIMKAIISLADTLGMETTAEGVETHDQLALVRELGCSQIQGFLFGEPMGPEDAAECVAKGKAGELKSCRNPRHSVFKTAKLLFGDVSIPVRVRNVSSGGALIETSANLPFDSEIRLELGSLGILPGFVCWSSGGKAGLRFSMELDPNLFLQKTRPSRILRS